MASGAESRGLTRELIALRVARELGDAATVACAPCQSQIGSGSLPTARIDSHALVMTPPGRRGAGAALKRLAAAFRALPMPVIGRIHDGGLWFDLRCLEDEAKFTAQLGALALDPPAQT